MRTLTATLFAATLAASLALAACGKLGPPLPPGPPDKVIWPHLYPPPPK